MSNAPSFIKFGSVLPHVFLRPHFVP